MKDEFNIEDAYDLFSKEKTSSSQNQCKGWVVFAVSDAGLNPDSLTQELGIQPDRVYYPNTATGQNGHWQINSTLSGENTLEEHFWSLLKRLIPIHRRLTRISTDYSLHFFCTVKKENEKVPVRISSRILLLIGYLGADIEIDFMT